MSTPETHSCKRFLPKDFSDGLTEFSLKWFHTMSGLCQVIGQHNMKSVSSRLTRVIFYSAVATFHFFLFFVAAISKMLP